MASSRRDGPHRRRTAVKLESRSTNEKRLPPIGLLVLLPCAAHADIIPSLTSISGGPGGHMWNYHAQLTEDSRAPSGPAPTTTLVSHDTVTGSFFTF